ncbi:FAD-binding domain-containing protein [Peniophora sp. CONT]|nr:FAD-binding domain-containing protein [Peniophora sp. CONT]
MMFLTSILLPMLLSAQSCLATRATVTNPFAAPCFRAENRSNSAGLPSCSEVQSNYTDRFFRLTSAGSYMNTQWETCQANGSQCLLDWADPSNLLAFETPRICEQGSVPLLTAEIENAQDVATALKRAKLLRMPVVVKNTGHDYKGRSSAPGSFSLWTHKLSDMSHHANFVPEGCDATVSAITIGAGVLTGDLLKFADTNNLTIVGGNDPTVGAAGGWLQGGGHSFISNTYGLGVDRVVQYRVVTADGQYLTASACRHQDLFWALRGGGGGTFGVVMEATVLADPKVPVQVALVSFNANDTTTRALWELVLENQLTWSASGWGGLVNQHQALYVNPILNSSAANASMHPLAEFASNLKDAVVKSVFIELPSYLSFFNTFITPSPAPVGENVALASRLIPASLLDSPDSRSDLLDALLASAANVSDIRIFSTTPFSFNSSSELTSVTPAWRTSVFHVVLDRVWNFNATKSDISDQYEALTASVGSLRDITPPASYQNEGDIHEPDHELAFWGDNYARLLSVKAKYDPDNLFDCWQCVGFKSDAPRFSCYI